MKMLLDVQFPPEPFNGHVRKGTAGDLIQKILADIKPDAAYFTARNGKRGAILVVNLPDPSKLPTLAEPFFLHFHASVEIHPFMTPEDLGKAGLEELGKKWG